MESVANANLCTRHDMISWVSYPYGGQSCYVYPRYLLDGTEWKLIDPQRISKCWSFSGCYYRRGLSFGHERSLRLRCGCTNQ